MTEALQKMRRYLRRVDSAIAKDLPPLLIAAELALVIDMANVVCGKELWEHLGRRAIGKARQSMALCQHCDNKVCIARSHPLICEACYAMLDAECERIDKLIEEGGEA